MKNFIKRFAAGMIAPAAVMTTIFSFNITPEKGVEPKKLDRPYVVEVIDAKGADEKMLKGISDQTEPFLISENFGAKPALEDKFSSFPDIRMGIGSKITMRRTPIYKIKDGKRSKEVRSWEKSVGELFSEQKIEIGQEDKVNFALDTVLEDGIEIKITRVAKTIVIEKEAIDYKVVKKSNSNLEKGNKTILQAGKKGNKNKFYEVIREDGEEVSRKLIKTEASAQPIDQIVEVGTKVVTYGSGVASIWKEDSDLVSACNFVSRGTKVHVVNLDNGKSVDVTCMGGGLRGDRIVDLSDTAFEKLGGSWSQGLLKNVRVEKYYAE